MVILENYNGDGERTSQGSGFIVSPEGKVLTNYHVIRGALRMVARTRDQKQLEVEYISGYDGQHDVAALKIAGDGWPCVHLGNSTDAKTGDHITALGAPMGLENTLSDGIISAVRERGTFRIFQVSAPISHGSSGGPLFNDYGDVIALAVATIEGGENLNFAVPIEVAKPLLTADRQLGFAELRAQTAVHRAVIASSLAIPPQVLGIDIAVPPQGGALVGSFSIAGGMGNDLGVSLRSAAGGIVWNGGVFQRAATVNIPLRGGQYKLILNNKVGPFWVSNKTITGTVELTYYK
ncbi:MAG: trypsin-like peptidase domain-containing protein [Ignavibacteriota bacterium]